MAACRIVLPSAVCALVFALSPQAFAGNTLTLPPLAYEWTPGSVSGTTWSSTTANTRDWTLSSAPTVGAPLAPTVSPGISQIINFDGTIAGTGTSFDADAITPSTADVSFELLFRPANTTQNSWLFETGGTGTGSAIFQSGNQIQFRQNATLEAVSSLTVSDVSDFIHIVGTFDTGSAEQRLFLGEVGSQTTQETLGEAMSGADWSGGGLSGLLNFNNGEGGFNVAPGGITDFEGEIAFFRVYDGLIAPADAQMLV